MESRRAHVLLHAHTFLHGMYTAVQKFGITQKTRTSIHQLNCKIKIIHSQDTEEFRNDHFHLN